MSLVRTTTALVCLVAIMAGSARAQDATLPPQGSVVVYLNSQQIVQSAPGAAEAQRTFEREIAQMRTELQQQSAVVDSLMRDYQRQEVMLSPQAKEQKQTEIQQKQQSLQNRQQELETQARQRQNDLLNPIIQRVTQVIEQIRAQQGYSIVLDVSADGGNVVAADPALDITAAVMERLGVTPADSTAGGGN
jgi:outer membrane protein